jgi:hypothetical protein
MLVVSADSGDHCLLRLEGEATLNCIDELHKLLLDAAGSHKEISLDFSQATELDVPVMQLLWSASRSGGVLRVVGETPGEIAASFRCAGLDSILTAATGEDHGEDDTLGG